MSVCKMCSVSIAGHRSSLDKTLDALMASSVFHPDDLKKFYSDVSSFVPLREENPYLAMESSLCAILKNDNVPEGDFSHITDGEINAYIRNNAEMSESIDKEISQAKSDIAEKKSYKHVIEQFCSIEYDLEDVFDCEFTSVKFGVFANSSYEKFKTNYSHTDIIFYPSKIDGELCYGVYFAPISMKEEATRIFSSLYFETLPVKRQKGTPKEITKGLEDDIKQLEEKLSELTDKQKNNAKIQNETASGMLACVVQRKKAFEIRKYAALYKDRFIICGWCPESDKEKLRGLVEAVGDVECTIEVLNKQTKLSPPVKLKNNPLVRPYEFYVGMYGMPSYTESDPTSFVAITYTLLFGIMFGDLGQGLVLALIGFLMWKLKKMPLGRILIPCGISSALFGVAYGSVFGFEELLNPMFYALGFHEKPIEVMKPATTQMIIYAAVGAGVVLVLMSILMNIFSCIRQKKFAHCLFSSNGVAGILFYISVLSLLLVSKASAVAIPVIIVTLLLMFFSEPLTRAFEKKKPFEEGQSISDFAMQTFFEVFETVLSYVTNTMSFLRVGAFILVHAGMMKVVFTLAEMSSGVPYVLILIVGNGLVMCLEALLVGIQVLRLEFYEMFSRFYTGEGEAYTPVTNK